MKWWDRERLARAQAVNDAPTNDFVELLKIGGLDKARHLRNTDLSGMSFAGADLRGFDFTGARLHGCRLDGARIAGARFDQAEFGAVDRMTGAWRRDNPHAPGVIGAMADLREAADWEVYAAGWRRPAMPSAAEAHLPPGAIFQDAPNGPEVVVVPAGEFIMGSPPDEGERSDNESPQHPVTIPQPFAIGRYPVTFAEWNAAVAAGGVNHKPDDAGWGRGDRPVINVSWDDAQAYIAWLREATGKAYRLPSEAEWEYCCRAGTTTPFWWGDTISTDQANYNGTYTYGGGKTGAYRDKTVPVKSFDPNPWGLYQVHGNVWEWCADPLHETYKSAPTDGSVWTDGGDDSLRVLRGGSWLYGPRYLRSAYRDGNTRDHRIDDVGFRLARTLNP